MRIALALAIGGALWAGTAARADLAEGTYAPDIEAKAWLNTDEPISLAELRGMTVVLVFWKGWHQGGEQVMPLMNLLNSRIGRIRGMFLIGLTDGRKDEVEEMLKREKVYFPIGTESESDEEYQISGWPRVVIIDPHGKVAWSGWADDIEELNRVTLEIMAETPPTKTHPEEAEIVRSELADAREALRADKFRDAYRAARTAYDHALTGDELKTRCQDMLDLIEALGRDKYAQAEVATDEKRYQDAVELLRTVRGQFRGMEVARRARKWLDTLARKHKEVAEILERENEEALAENVLYKALQDLQEDPRKIGAAYVKLEEILGEYPESPAARKARIVKERMEANETVMGYVRDHKASRDCEAWLFQARAYESVGKPNQAKSLYRRILDEYTNTIYADQAAERLAQLQ